MSGDIENGICECCGKEGSLIRTYYYYNIPCDCCGVIHNGKQVHAVFIRHCKDCKPKPPKYITVYLEGSNYLIHD